MGLRRGRGAWSRAPQVWGPRGALSVRECESPERKCPLCQHHNNATLPARLLQPEAISSSSTRSPLAIWRGPRLGPATGLILILPGASPNRGLSRVCSPWVHRTSIHLPTGTSASSSQASDLQHLAQDGNTNKGAGTAIVPTGEHFQTLLAHLPTGSSAFSSHF